MGVRCVAATCAVLAIAAVRPAFADQPAVAQTDSSSGELSPSYLWDGGAIPFLWAPLAGRLLLDAYGRPRETPLVFDPAEGGAEQTDWEVPGWSISAFGGAAAAGMIAGGDRSRFYHVKGMAEALSTGVLVTGLIKVTFGRHRPDWSDDVNTESSRRSFPSGHATQAFAVATYSILYLNDHVFDGDDRLWLRGATYGVIALSAAGFAGERVYHNRHHVSDVAVGGALGTLTSTLFYVYQERRFRKRELATRSQLFASPTSGGASVGFTMTW